MNDDLILALWPTDSLFERRQRCGNTTKAWAVSIGHVVKSKEEVSAIIAQAGKAGAAVIDPPRDRFWGGCSGYFHDPDGHLWEVAWNPQVNVPD